MLVLLYVICIAETAAIYVMFHALFTLPGATGEDLRYKKESWRLMLVMAIAIPVLTLQYLA